MLTKRRWGSGTRPSLSTSRPESAPQLLGTRKHAAYGTKGMLNKLRLNFMSCSICNDLHRAFQRTHSSYIDARTAAFYRVSTEIAAMKQIAMERAKSDLYEHHLDCPSARLAGHPRNELGQRQHQPLSLQEATSS